ncbi:uncharacterized protein LOC142239799 [Haematobia irritans]|uniref:uncharacterized protein LOC142239799 n=1 Tax=Haematobia irritans TaxID=7368 RepID=UPI003F4F927B
MAYNLRSGPAGQIPPREQASSDDELNTTMLNVEETSPISTENDQLSTILAGINDLVRAVAESRRDIDSIRDQIQLQQQYTSIAIGQSNAIDARRREHIQLNDYTLGNQQQTIPPLPHVSSDQLGATRSGNIPSAPKIYDLPVFSGKPEDWPLFSANFKDSTETFNYNNRHNLMRLQKGLIGEAKEAVSSMLIHPSNVPNIMKELEFRFGRPELLVRSQLNIIRQFPVITPKRMDQIVNFSTKVRNVEAFLNSAHCSHHLTNATLLEELVSKLPIDKQYEWARSSITIKPYATISDFSNWLGELANVVSTMSLNSLASAQGRPVMLIEDKEKKDTAKCYICQGQHSIYKCKKFIDELTVSARWEKVKELKLCFCCLKKGHGTPTCRTKKPCGINNCKRPHHKLLHDGNSTQSISTEASQPLLNCRSQDEASNLFKIIPIKISGPSGFLKIFALFDEGSSISLLDEEIAKQLGLKGRKTSLTLQWYGDNTVTEKSYKVQCEIEWLCEPRSRYSLKNIYTVTPKLLLGLDNAYLSIPTAIKEVDEQSPIAIKTKLGWVAYGPTNNFSSPHPTVLLLKNQKHSDERFNIVNEFFSTENEFFSSRTSFKIFYAEKRLFAIENKMCQDSGFSEKYKSEMKKNIEKGYARPLSAKEVANTMYPIWYLPHFGVVNPNKPNKLRVVFDAAAKTLNTSLNSSLVKGPEQAKPLLNILLQFRQGKIAVAADIREMFSQVKIRAEDQHTQRFLWRDGDRSKPIQHFVMTSMIFGAICSPCCAEYIKNRNAEEYSTMYPNAATAIVNKHYVDDFVCSFNNVEEALGLCKEFIEVHAKAGFELRGFISNCEKLEAELNPTVLDNLNQINMEKQSTTDKILGMCWNKKEDCFEFKIQFFGLNSEVLKGNRLPTKREMLKIVMSAFDPFGLIADFLLYGKILVQLCWKHDMDWDDIIPEYLHKKFTAWWREFQEISKFKIHRCISFNLYNASNIQLHIFVDASQDAFAAVCYLRVLHQFGIDVSFIMGKVRCAPKKLMSIPRLELQAAVLGVRLGKTLSRSYEFNINSMHYWSDSQTVVQWIYSTERRFKAFVSHRIAEILKNSEPAQWKWIPTHLNSADAGTRPLAPPKFVHNGIWLNGPEFLREDESSWPILQYQRSDSQEEEIKSCLIISSNKAQVIEFERFSSILKLKRTIAWLLRFIKKKRIPEDINVSELKEAEVVLCRLIQSECYEHEIKCLKRCQPIPKSSPIYSLVPYIDEYGLLRVSGRIDEAVYMPHDARRPIILPEKHYVSELVLRHHHQRNYHQNMSITINDVRQKFWIPKIKSL